MTILPEDMFKKVDHYDKLRHTVTKPGDDLKISTKPPKNLDDLLVIQKVINGWIVTIRPANVPQEFCGGDIETLVFNNLQDLFEAIKIFYEQET